VLLSLLVMALLLPAAVYLLLLLTCFLLVSRAHGTWASSLGDDSACKPQYR
jgi:hypothetical protein